MRRSKNRFSVVLSLVIGCVVLSCDLSFSEPLVPEGLVMQEDFKPGMGSAVGKVQLVQGDVVIIHGKELRGYQARKDLPLYGGDMIVTRERGRIRFALTDESVITMASNTKLVITKSVYDRAVRSRSTFLRMALGRARFYVKKLFELKRSEFKVGSPTAIVGVRGSGWIEEVGATFTRVTAEGDTRLDVWNPEIPDKPILLKDFEQTRVLPGALPTEPMEVKPEAIEEMLREFVVRPDVAEREVREIPPPERKGVLVNEEELARPEEPRGLEEIERPPLPLIVEREDIKRQLEDVIEKHEEILEETQEEVLRESLQVPASPSPPAVLPPFPGTPP
ncbi:MAG: FecR domain-containing protein [Deltaproteobacteria bacterium]|nr:FecR domain-containing protein [Deltaproteobacteria bacterium]